MKPTKQLIRGLRETAHKLRNGANHVWMDMPRCNCGLLAQTLLDMDCSELRCALFDAGHLGTWEHAVCVWHCDATGLPSNTAVRTLFAAGLEAKDFARIEKLGGNGSDYKDANNVAAWMDREADELERRRIAERFEEDK